jgi:predicted DCC family thiol-disulfide oxidoreductase YuxK
MTPVPIRLAQAPGSAGRAAILYDPGCGFCRVSLAVLLRWDRQRRLRPVALGTEEADSLLEGMPEEKRMASWHLVVSPRWQGNVAENATNPGHLETPARSVHSAGAAFPELFRLLPGGRPLARLSGRFPRASERAYRLAADHRSLLGRALPAAARRWADRVLSGSRPDGR